MAKFGGILRRVPHALARGWRGTRDASVLVRDQTGRELPSRAYQRIREMPGDGETTPERFTRLRRAIISAGPKRLRPRNAIVGAALITVVFVLLLFSMRSAPWFVYPPFAIFVCFHWANAWFVATKYIHRLPIERQSEILLAHDFCPVCAYDLRGAPTQGEDRVRCPECSAEWKKSPAPSEPSAGSPP